MAWEELDSTAFVNLTTLVLSLVLVCLMVVEVPVALVVPAVPMVVVVDVEQLLNLTLLKHSPC